MLFDTCTVMVVIKGKHDIFLACLVTLFSNQSPSPVVLFLKHQSFITSLHAAVNKTKAHCIFHFTMCGINLTLCLRHYPSLVCNNTTTFHMQIETQKITMGYV